MAAYQLTVLAQYPGWSTWISPLLIVFTLLTVFVLILISRFANALHVSQDVAHAAIRVVTLSGVPVLLVSPLVWSSVSLTYPADGGSPLAGPRTMDIQEVWANLINSEPINSSDQCTLPKSEQKLLTYSYIRVIRPFSSVP